MDIEAAKLAKAKKRKGKSLALLIINLANTADTKNCGTRLTSFGSKELLLLAKILMKVSCNGKHNTDKKANNF